MNVIDRLSISVGKSCYVLYFASMIIIGMEIIMRYMFDHPSSWAYELSLSLCAVAWVLSSGYVGAMKRDISITFLESLLSSHNSRRVKVISTAMTVLGYALLSIAIYPEMINSVLIVERTGSSFNPAMPVVLKIALFLGAVLGSLQGVSNLVALFKEYSLKKGDV